MTGAVRVVVLGDSAIGVRHARALAALPGVEATVAAAPRELGEALAAGPVDGVLVATDPARHAADATEAIGAGCHVLVEKPLAPAAGEARDLVLEARRAGRRAHVACHLRFDAGLRWVRERLPRLGALRLADAECLRWLPGEHALRDLAEEVDYTAWLLGRQRRVAARATDETALLVALHDGDLPLTLRISCAAQPPSRSFRVWGEGGRLEWDLVAQTARLVDVAGARVESFRWDGVAASYALQAEAWVRSLRGEPAPELVSAEEGARAVAVCDAARAATERGPWRDVE